MSQLDKVSEGLKKYFNEKGLTQVQIAKMLNSTQPIVFKLLNGRPFGKRTAAKWSETFGFNPNWLITGEGEIMLADKHLEINKTKKGINASGDYFAEQILNMISDGVLYTASVVKDKDAIIESKDEEIQRLNREIGSLQQQIEQLQNELKEKSVARTGAGVA